MALEDKYAKHKLNARNNPKLLQILQELGWEGYGLYWGLVEILYENNGELTEKELKAVCWKEQMDEKKVHTIMDIIGCTKINGKIQYEGVTKRIAEVEAYSKKQKANANKRWNKKKETEQEEKPAPEPAPTPKPKPEYINHLELKYVKLTKAQYEKLKKDYPTIDIDEKINRLEEYVASTGNKNKYKDYNIVLRKAIREGWFETKTKTITKAKYEAPVPHWYDKYSKDPKCSEDTPREDILREKKAKGTITQEEEKELKKLEAELENLTELAETLFKD